MSAQDMDAPKPESPAVKPVKEQRDCGCVYFKSAGVIVGRLRCVPHAIADLQKGNEYAASAICSAIRSMSIDLENGLRRLEEREDEPSLFAKLLRGKIRGRVALLRLRRHWRRQAK